MAESHPGTADRRIGENEHHLGWYARGYLPDADFPATLQSITYRLADSLPRHVLDTLEQEPGGHPAADEDTERRRRIEALLDAGMGSCILRHEWAAMIVINNWRHFHGERYDLIAWVVMPNHVHLLIRTYEGHSLLRLVQSWKRYTGRRILDRMGVGKTAVSAKGGPSRPRRLWYRDHWDRYVRDEKHSWNVVNYIHENPVRAGLVRSACDWRFNSAGMWKEQTPSVT